MRGFLFGDAGISRPLPQPMRATKPLPLAIDHIAERAGLAAVAVGDSNAGGSLTGGGLRHGTYPSLALKSDLVVELVRSHQWPAGSRIGLARDRRGTRLASDSLVAQVARNHRLVNERHGLKQKLNDVVPRPRSERFRPVESGTGISKVGQDRHHRACVPWLRVARGHPDRLFGVKLLRGCLLRAYTDPTEQHRGDDPTPFRLAQAPNGRTGRNGATHLDDPTRTRNGGGCSISLPLILDCGQRDLSDSIADFSHHAQSGRSTGAAGVDGVDPVGPLPPPSN